MSGDLTAVTYHYVRPPPPARGRRLGALDVDIFRRQVDRLGRWGTFVDVGQVANWSRFGEPLPRRAVLLTFDDGYADHFIHVRSVLIERRIPAVFFLPGRAILDRVPLDANLVQFVIASAPSIAALESEVDAEARNAVGADGSLLLRERFRRPGPFDDAPTSYVKSLLQFALPEPHRSRLLTALFRRHVTTDLKGFADDLYLSIDQASQLLADGFHLGGHGWSHRRLSHLSDGEAEDDIARSLHLIDQLDPERGRTAFCYPYGDQAATEALDRHGVLTAFTVERRLADRGDRPLALPRIDANDVMAIAG